MAMPKLLRELLALPTAAFREDAVLSYLEAACGRMHGVTCTRDRSGNLLAHYRVGRPRKRPIALAAHTDHPGFVALEQRPGGSVIAEFRGGVRSEYFAGSKVRFWTADGPVRGVVRKIIKEVKVRRGRRVLRRPDQVLIDIQRGDVAPNDIGMWDLPEPRLVGDRVRARGCDDIAGCAAILETLRRVSRRGDAGEFYALFTRAEEVGFVGAIAAARSKTLPVDTPIVAIETSSTLPTAPLGAGPILRVGDRASTFTPALTSWCERVADGLTRRRKSFTFQRKLMDGGTCESTAFCAYGHEATGICVALGNYHNMNTQRSKIDSEFISLRDWRQMVDWFEALVLDASGYRGDDPALRKQMDARLKQYRHLL